MATRGTTLETDAAYSPAVSPELDNHWTSIASWRSAQSSLFSAFKTIGEKLLIRQVDLDATLDSKDLTTALKEMIRQMTGAETVNASSVSAGAQTSVGSPTGTLKIVTSLKRYDGLKWQMCMPEVIRFSVTADSQSGGATARNEPISVKGAAAINDTSAYNWPAGSGCNTSINVVDAQSDNNRGTLLYNGSFESFTTANAPDDWRVDVGVVGTDVLEATSADSYSLDDALKLVGDGSTLITIRQPFDTAHSTTLNSGGTPAELEPDSQYAVGMWIKRGSSSIGAGVLRVALVDGSNTVTNDASSTANSFTVDLTALTTSYVFYSGVFRTPKVVPTTGFKLELKVTTAITSTRQVFIDDVAFTEMISLYKGGPSVAAFAGSVDPIKNDQWTIAVTNTMGVLAMWFERFYALNQKELILPYDEAAGESLADTLVS